MNETGWRPLVPEAVAALLVLAVGFAEATVTWAMTGGGMEGFARALAAQALGIAFAVGMCRRAPGAALGLVWGLGLFHVASGAPIMLVEFALTAVFFGGARWGRPATVVMSALSVPLAVVVAFVVYEGRVVSLHLLLGGSKLGGIIREEPTVHFALSLAGLLVVAAPWPAGLAMRFLDRARTSRVAMLAAEEAAAGAWRETEQAREIAHLRDEQARLARDVHDVVGHSLTVILAQAESGQYLDDTAALKKTLRTVATSARSSLQDVRRVLSSTRDATVMRDDADRFDGLIADVRASGHDIVATEMGTPGRLTREAAAVANRVFQEMLTNAIRHGRRDRPITAERHWPSTQAAGVADTLRIEVTNVAGAGGPDGNPAGRGLDGSPAGRAGRGLDGSPAGRGLDGSPAGRGLDGMRRRLEAIGGYLDVRRHEQPDGATFSVTAYLPVRGGAR